jgi:hypothetical protein
MKSRNEAAMLRYREEYQRCCGVLVRQLRTEKGWSLEGFSKKAAISVVWLRKFKENQLTYRRSHDVKLLEDEYPNMVWYNVNDTAGAVTSPSQPNQGALCSPTPLVPRTQTY